jgi:hypothetical protein
LASSCQLIEAYFSFCELLAGFQWIKRGEGRKLGKFLDFLG